MCAFLRQLTYYTGSHYKRNALFKVMNEKKTWLYVSYRPHPLHFRLSKTSFNKERRARANQQAGITLLWIYLNFLYKSIKVFGCKRDRLALVNKMFIILLEQKT